MYGGYGGMCVGISAFRATERGGGDRASSEPMGFENSKNSPFSGLTGGDVQMDECK
jgi:hypothetical protein